MPYRVEWDNEAHTIIYCELSGAWSWGEYYEMVGKSRALTDTEKHRVDIITNILRANKMPSGMATLHGKNALDAAHPRLDVVVITGFDTFVKVMLNVFRKLYPKFGSRYWLADTPADARGLIADLLAKGEDRPPTLPKRPVGMPRTTP